MATKMDWGVVRPVVNPGSNKVTGDDTRGKQSLAFDI